MRNLIDPPPLVQHVYTENKYANFCIDCAYLHKTVTDRWHLCRHPSLGPTHLYDCVTGEMVVNKTASPACVVVRQDASKCGIHGAWFKAADKRVIDETEK